MSAAAEKRMPFRHLATFEGASTVEPFPVATDLETASDALENYLG